MHARFKEHRDSFLNSFVRREATHIKPGSARVAPAERCSLSSRCAELKDESAPFLYVSQGTMACGGVKEKATTIWPQKAGQKWGRGCGKTSDRPSAANTMGPFLALERHD